MSNYQLLDNITLTKFMQKSMVLLTKSGLPPWFENATLLGKAKGEYWPLLGGKSVKYPVHYPRFFSIISVLFFVKGTI